ncbi:FIG149030: hypothetical protein [hydrothermal vent metagenome]|uniref:DUF3375 domain-containing protein n=1 Tax=hydrothermal vent metagenome TaxID=652676 RepID=A0A3B1E3T1_9ZZZZ
MDYHQIKYHLVNATPFKILRSENAPLILSFFHAQFKISNRIAIPYSELLENLSFYIEEIKSFDSSAVYANTPEGYLDQWCDENHRYLRKYYEANQDDPLFELTPETEKALSWIQDLQKKEFVGTESRFFRIFELIKEVVQQSNEDPQERIDLLKSQKKKLDEEIRKIQKTGMVKAYSSTQIKERFMEASDTAHRLLSDFRQVEQNFKDFARQIQQKRLGEQLSKGTLLQFVLDTEDVIRESDQGRSFHAFYQFLSSPRHQEEMEHLVDKLYCLDDLQHMRQDLVLKHLKNHLIDAGEKIMQSNHRLAEQLRRMLDEKILMENRRAAALLSEIKKAAFRLAVHPPKERNFFYIDGEVKINMVMERKPWNPPQIPDFNCRAMEASSADTEAIDLSILFNQFYINMDTLRRNIEAALLECSSITLVELIKKYPVNNGLAEVVGYFSIASEEGYEINEDQKEEVLMTYQDETVKKFLLPRVVFKKNKKYVTLKKIIN